MVGSTLFKMNPLQRCFVFSTYEMGSYCIALTLNRTLLVLVFIVDYQRVELSHGKKPIYESRKGVFARMTQRRNMDIRYFLLITTSMLSNVSHVKRQYLVNLVDLLDRHCDPKLSKNTHNKNDIKVLSKLQFSKESLSNTFEVEKAELLHVNLIVQHNLPFSLADHLSKRYPDHVP